MCTLVTIEGAICLDLFQVQMKPATQEYCMSKLLYSL